MHIRAAVVRPLVGDNGLVQDEVSSFEVPYTPGLRASWAVWMANDPDPEPDRLQARRPAASMLEIEQVIADWVESRRQDVERVVYKFAGRDVHLRGGSCAKFRWALLRMVDWRCLDCRVDTDAIEEYYMVRDPIWQQANPDVDGHLCVGCLEQRLDRKLSASDFADVGVNDSTEIPRSARLTARLNSPTAGSPADEVV